MLAPERGPRAGETGGQPLVLLVDRHALFLSAISKVIQDGRHARVEVATSSEQALAILSKQQVDLVICDLQSAPLAGPDLLARASQLNTRTRGILLAEPEDAASLVEALTCGAAGFFTKDATPEEFLDGIEAVLAGHFVVGRNLVRATPDQLGNDGRNRGPG